MTADHFDAILRVLLGRRPFRAFSIEMRGGRVHEIDHPDALHMIEDVAAFTSLGGVRALFDHEGVDQVYDCPSADIPNSPTP